MLGGEHPESASDLLAIDALVGQRLLEQHARTARFLCHESSADAFQQLADPVTSAEIIVALEAGYAAPDEDLDEDEDEDEDGACY